MIGGTGAFGKGLIYRWASRHPIVLGSRSQEKASKAALDYGAELARAGVKADLVGVSNREAAAAGDLVVLVVKYDHMPGIIDQCRQELRNKVVLSPVVPLQGGASFCYAPPAAGSAALWLAGELPQASVVAALHTVPAHRLQRIATSLDGDVPLCGDDDSAKQTVAALVREIPHLRPLDAGPLQSSALLEPMVPLILNLKKFGGQKDTTLKFV